jgi:hypothetical protein
VSRAFEFSPSWRKRQAQKRKRQEARWAAKSSAVTVRRIDDERPDESDEEESSPV